jgi:hypothetical protein
MRPIFVMVLARQRRQLTHERSLQPGHGQPRVQPRKPGNGQRRDRMRGERASTLEPEQSTALREKLFDCAW